MMDLYAKFFFWLIIISLAICFSNMDKHGQPRKPHNVWTDAITIILYIPFVIWLFNQLWIKS